MFLVGMVTLSSEAVHAGDGRSDRPKAIALVRADAVEGRQATTNLHHQAITLDPAMRALLPVMDGSLDHAALAARLAGEALGGRLAFHRNGQALTGADSIRAVAKEHLPALLDGMAKAGLLAG
jgi:hypothetical protein